MSKVCFRGICMTQIISVKIKPTHESPFKNKSQIFVPVLLFLAKSLITVFRWQQIS